MFLKYYFHNLLNFHQQVLLEKDFGVIHGLKEGGIMIDMTTSKPSLAEEIYKISKEKGIKSLDAPVSGGDIVSENFFLINMNTKGSEKWKINNYDWWG